MPRPKLAPEEKRLRKKLRQRNWRERNPERSKELNIRARNKLRQETIRSTDGIRVTVNKRPRPNDVCEVCGRTGVKKLDYHHWNNEHLEYGVWVCYPCHSAIERIDKGFIYKYLELVKEIDPEYYAGILRRIETWKQVD